jgi:hypothetical protein
MYSSSREERASGGPKFPRLLNSCILWFYNSEYSWILNFSCYSSNRVRFAYKSYI